VIAYGWAKDIRHAATVIKTNLKLVMARYCQKFGGIVGVSWEKSGVNASGYQF